MRISIRLQLGLLVLLTSLVAIAVLAVATWVNNYKFVLDIVSVRLTVAATLKAADIATSLTVLARSIQAGTTRILIQNSLRRYNEDRNNSADNWVDALPDLIFALNGGHTDLLQAAIWPRDDTGPAGFAMLLNATVTLSEPVVLPYLNVEGHSATLGTGNDDFPPDLYPNFISSFPGNSSVYHPPAPLNTTYFQSSGVLLLGPLWINQSFALLSMTVPFYNNNTQADILGYITVVLNARSILAVTTAREALDRTGQTLILKPHTVDNHFSIDILPPQSFAINSRTSSLLADFSVQFALPPKDDTEDTKRHAGHDFGTSNPPFPMRQYPAMLTAYKSLVAPLNSSGGLVSTTNEEHESVSVGYAIPPSNFCDWVLLVEKDKNEVYEPINRLRNILLECVFGTVFGIILFVIPIAFFAVSPIKRLTDAAQTSYRPELREKPEAKDIKAPISTGVTDIEKRTIKRRAFFASTFRRRKQSSRTEALNAHGFVIPSKVVVRKRWIQDELTDLTDTYNDMIDELLAQYETLEDKVAERTKELEASRKLAEAANESKTLFVANISHELKTPLNGILGMCQVCMTEKNVDKIKKSLSVVHESGELLLSLLNDLLTFTKHQTGHQITIAENGFRLSVITSQILNIFRQQATEAKIELSVVVNAELPDSDWSEKEVKPRYTDLELWGDKQRILQVILNLVNNSLKFTPAGGEVQVKIQCGERVDPAHSPDQLSNQSSTKARSLRNLKKRISGSLIHKASKDGSIRSRPGITHRSNKVQPLDAVTIGSRLMPDSGAEHAVEPDNARVFWFSFQVQDTGPGIPEELHQRIFEPFVQGDISLSRKHGGTGLGLSICSQLSILMGGSISLQSTVGLGSTFTMHIPLKVLKEFHKESSRSFDDSKEISGNASWYGDRSVRSVRQSITSQAGTGKVRLVGLSQPFFANDSPPVDGPSSPSQSLGNSTSHLRILVADDNAINRKVVLQMLKLEQVNDVIIAVDGQEAVDKVQESIDQKTHFDLIFMDIQMPNLDGIQSTRVIRGMGFTAPIVALTAFTEEANQRNCLEAGMDYFLAKPIRRPALKHVLTTYCHTIREEAETPFHGEGT